MKNFSLKALGAAILTLGLVVAGSAVPAHAATLTNPSVTSSGAASGTTNPNPITVSFTTTTNTNVAAGVSVILPTGWTWVSPYSPQSWNNGHQAISSVIGCSPTVSAAYATGGIVGAPELWLYCGSAISSGTSFTVVIPAGAVNVGSGVNFTITIVSNNSGNPTNVDQSIVSLNGAVSSNTVTYNSNGGSGAMADQSASTATALSANAFTRSGYTFAGWNTAADGSGTAYADGASFPFSANTTLYAQWTATLATTGLDGAPYLFGGLALALTGGAFMLIARRKQSN